MNGFWIDALEYALEGGFDFILQSEVIAENSASNNSQARKPFLSENFFFNNLYSVTEIFAIFTLIELPFQAQPHTTSTNGNRFELVAGSNIMLFLKELIEKENQTMSLDITVNQKFFDPHDRFQLAEDGYTKVNKSVTRFVKGKLYGSRVSVTNTGDSHQNSLQIITEIPQGAIPMRSLDYLETRNETLDNLQTKEFMYYFYFPNSGKFTSYAASVTKDGFLLASSQKGLFEIFVHDSLEATNLNSINEIMSLGSKQDIVKFMKE